MEVANPLAINSPRIVLLTGDRNWCGNKAVRPQSCFAHAMDRLRRLDPVQQDLDPRRPYTYLRKPDPIAHYS